MFAMPTVILPSSNQKVVEGLQLAVAQSYVLTALAHSAHWNIVGSDFFQLHAAFGDQYEASFDDADVFAERIRALDSFVMVDLAEFKRIAGMPELKAPFTAQQAVDALIVANNKAISDLKVLVDVSGKANDLETQNMVLDKIFALQKRVWMLRSFAK
jgi:starvation-inducible DNA-binding protein